MQVPTLTRVVTLAATESVISGSGSMNPRPIASKHQRLSNPARSMARAPSASVLPVNGLPSGFIRGMITPSLIVVLAPRVAVHVRGARLGPRGAGRREIAVVSGHAVDRLARDAARGVVFCEA